MPSNLERIQQLRDQLFPDHSDAAKYWDSLTPEWRGVVLHAVSVYGRDLLNASLANCNWRELYARLDHRRMMQIRTGIQHARNLFAGFGSLRERDFAPRTARNPDKTSPQQNFATAPALPESTAALLASRNKLHQHTTQGHQV